MKKNKVTIVLNEPTSCAECPCGYSYVKDDILHTHCRLEGNDIQIEYGKDTSLPYWCPLIVIVED